MNRNTAIELWREVCGSDMVMTLPPNGRIIEEFARRIEELGQRPADDIAADHARTVAVAMRRAANIADGWNTGQQAAKEIRREALRIESLASPTPTPPTNNRGNNND